MPNLVIPSGRLPSKVVAGAVCCKKQNAPKVGDRFCHFLRLAATLNVSKKIVLRSENKMLDIMFPMATERVTNSSPC